MAHAGGRPTDYTPETLFGLQQLVNQQAIEYAKNPIAYEHSVLKQNSFNGWRHIVEMYPQMKGY